MSTTMRIFLFIFFQIQQQNSLAMHYGVTMLKNVSLENPERNTKARSQLECLMRCQRIPGKEGFYRDNGECFCVSGVKSGNGGGFTGNTYSKVLLLTVLLSNFF